MRPPSEVPSTAVFIFLSAATRTRVVSSDLYSFTFYCGSCSYSLGCNSCALSSILKQGSGIHMAFLKLWAILIWIRSWSLYLDAYQNSSLAHSFSYFIKHIVESVGGCILVFHKRILLA